VTRFRLSRPAQSDLAYILAASVKRWGADARHRYARAIAAAMRQIAADPNGPLTRDRADLLKGTRSFHVRHARVANRRQGVRRPVHVIYYRVNRPDVVEILRVLHERMEPRRHIENL
jgi:toxin ParE1/3/4